MQQGFLRFPCTAHFTDVWERQIIAIDSAKIHLSNRKALLEKYGIIGRGASSPYAIAIIVFNVLNDRVLVAQLKPMSVDDRVLSIKHMKKIKSKVPQLHPKHGSWLYIAKIGLNVMTRQCLFRRIEDICLLRQELAAWKSDRNEHTACI